MIAGTALAEGGGPADLVDRVGDVVNADTKAPLDAAQADIASATVDYAADGLKLALEVRQFSDPLTDPNWVSDSTYALWSLDTDGDAKIDYELNFGVDQGKLYGDVFKPTDAKDAPAQCSAKSVTADKSGFYTVVLDPACLGNPKAVGFSVQMYYDTNAKDPNAPVAIDLLPDKGLAGPVPAPGAPEATAYPRGAPAPQSFGAPRHSASAPASDPAASPQPAPAPAAAPAPTVAPKPAAPAPAPRTSARAPAAAGAPATPAAPAPAPPSNLARTGANRNVAATGGALLALGGFALLLSAQRQNLAACRARS